MAEPVEVAEVTAPVGESPKEAPKFKLDPTRPMVNQVDKLLNSLPAEEVKEADAPKEEPKPEDKPAIIDEKAADEVVATVEQRLPLPGLDDIPAGVELPEAAKYILDNLSPLQVMGHQGEGQPDKLFSVKRLEDLPDDFEFSSRRAELAFMAANASQELNARDLLARYRQQEQQKQYQELRQQDAKDIQSDIAELQKDGILEKFKYESTDPRFETDEAVIDANAIYKIWEDTNAAYTKNGRVNKITYLDAADKYYAQKYRDAQKNPPETPKEETPKETPNQTARKEVAAKVSAPSSATPEKTRVRMRQGSTFQDVLKAYNSGRI